ncbi:MAG: SpoIID/LytB domain-containing protein [Armatimonadota bacterium]
MTGGSWAAAALVCLHLGSLGALPPEVRTDGVRAYATGEQPLRVLIAGGASSALLRPNAPVAVRDPSGKQLGVVKAGATIAASPAAGGVRLKAGRLQFTGPSLAIVPSTAGGGVTVSFEGGWGRRGFYPGAVEIGRAGSALRVIESVCLETYVAGVVASEMPSSFPLEAMKAQAIAARTYALYHLGAHGTEGADLCGSVHCQAYAGQAKGDSRAARAARETAGQVVTYDGLLVDAMYSAACGGETSTAWEVRQGKLLPYLVGEPDSDGGDAYCGRDHDVTWTRRYSRAEAEKLVRANLATVLSDPGVRPGKLNGLELVADPATGRAQWLKVLTANGTYQVRGDATRWLFGSGRPGPAGLRSTAFGLATKTDASGRPTAFVFTGRGHGHGIGLCQWGSRGRAMAGQTAEEIVAAYYRGATVVDLSQ